MKKIAKSKSVLINWTISYLLILLIPITIFIYGSFVTVNTVRREVSDANALILDNVQTNIDDHLASMKAAFKFTYLNNLFTVLRQSGDANAAFTHNSYDLIRVLTAYATAAKQDLGITIYFSGKDYLVGNNTANATQTLYYAQQSIGMKSDYTAWLSLLSAKYANNFSITSGIKLGYANPCLTYSQTVRGSDGDINIFITLPLAVIAGCCDSLSDRYLILADTDGKSLHHFTENQSVADLDLTLPSGEAITGTDSRSYVCTYAKSQEADLYYAIITSEESYWSSLRRVTYLFIAAIALALVLGTLATWMLLRRNYRPLENITRLFQKYGTQKNEFDLIHNSYLFLSDENKNMRDMLSLQSDQLRGRYLLSRLKGRLTSFSENDMNAFYQTDNQGLSYCLIVFTVAAASDLVLQQYRDELEYESIHLFTIDNVFAELMTDLTYDKIEDGHTLMYLLHLDDAMLSIWNEEKITRMSRIHELFSTQLSTQLSIIISENTDKFDQIRHLFSDAMNALEYQSILGESGVLLTADYKTVSTQKQNQTDIWPVELGDAVSEGDYAACEKIVAQIFNEFRQNTAVTFSVFRISVINYLYVVMNAFYEVISDHDLRYKLVVKTANLVAADQIEQLRDNLSQLLFYACQTIQIQSTGNNSILINNIQNFVQQHYADSNLNISTLSREFSRNPRYLSHLYSQQTGEGLLDFINQVRVRQAEHLMATTSMSLDEISARTGFTNTRTFRRAFMRVTGLQPSKYLDTLKAKMNGVH